MTKFDFSVITRNGHKVESLHIYGKDLPDAEHKLRQMYLQCEITQCRTIELDKTLLQSADIEDVLSLIAKYD